MTNPNRRSVAPVRKLLAAVLGTIAVFVMLFGAGMSSWAIVALGVAMLVLAIGLGMVNVARRGARAWVAGTAHVRAVSEPPAGVAFGRAELHIVVAAPGLPAAAVTVRDPRVPVAKWPDPGATLPVMVAIDDLRRVRIQWDDVMTHAEAAAAESVEEYVEPEPDPRLDDLLADAEAPPWIARERRRWSADPTAADFAAQPADRVVADRTLAVRDPSTGPIVLEGTVIEADTPPRQRRRPSPFPRPATDVPLHDPTDTPPADASTDPTTTAPTTTDPTTTDPSPDHAASPSPADGTLPHDRQSRDAGDSPPHRPNTDIPSPRIPDATSTTVARTPPAPGADAGTGHPGSGTPTAPDAATAADASTAPDAPTAPDVPAPRDAPTARDAAAAAGPAAAPGPGSPPTVPSPRRELPPDPDLDLALDDSSPPRPARPAGPVDHPGSAPAPSDDPPSTGDTPGPAVPLLGPIISGIDEPPPPVTSGVNGVDLAAPAARRPAARPPDEPPALADTPDEPPAARDTPDQAPAAPDPPDQAPTGDAAHDHLDELITAYPSARPGPSGAIHGIGMTVLVTDLDNSRRFYRDLLGFHEIDTGRGTAVLASGDTRLVLRVVHAVSAGSARPIHLNLEVGDLAAMHAELVRRGATFSHGPRVVSRGDRLELWAAELDDPDGHRVAISQWRAVE